VKAKWDRHTIPLLCAITLASLPHLQRAPIWLSGSTLVYFSLVLAAALKAWPAPPRALKWLFILAGVAAVKLTYGLIVGREPGMALFVLMAYLKLLEIRTQRDRMVALCMAYFLLAANLFFFESLIMAAHMIVSVWATTAVMIHIQAPDSNWRRHLKTAAALVVQAVPVMVVLFFLFPRIQGSLWGMPRGAAGTTGFSSTLSLGDVSSIVQNNEVAFRATFAGAAPPPEERYWRGIVFWRFDGVSWERTRSLPARAVMPLQERPTSYTITLEPSGARWMFALDMPAKAAPDTWLDADRTLRAATPIIQRVSHQLTSYRRYRTAAPQPWERRRGLQLPDNNPRTLALGRQWAETYTAAADIFDAAVAFISDGDFVYTLDPPPPDENPVDQFLFETRRGYCEHFAASFALLMRAAGIPARVVGGYLGGEPNPYGDYIIVRQSDAHAWVEILDDDRGWVRFDPTALVAPNRIAMSVAQVVPQEELPAYLIMEGYGWAGKGLKALSLSWDAVNLRWHRWVASYSHRHQARLLSRVGISMASWRGAALSGLAAVGLTVIIIGVMVIRPRFRRSAAKAPEVKAYEEFLRKVKKAGLPAKAVGDGPVAYAGRIASQRPDLEGSVNAVTDTYVRCRYGQGSSAEDLDRLRRLVRRFDPTPRASE
jgi:transglutaminase-like putative cysteine protease